jgi:DHA2 family multidrug resistance protein
LGFGLALSCADTSATDYEEMFWPQVVRGASIMLCILGPTSLALGHIAKAGIPDASGLFNMMRNLGGAIGIALIDTVIYSRAPTHAQKFLDRLASGDVDAARSVGIPLDQLGPALFAPEGRATLKALVDKAAFVEAINDAWGVVAVITLAALACVPFARTTSTLKTLVSVRKGDVRVRARRIRANDPVGH